MTDTMKKRILSVAFIAMLVIALLAIAFAAPVGQTALAEGDPELILSSSVTVDGEYEETSAGSRIFRSISEGAQVTVTYAIVKNDGLVEGIFTPAYDKTAFALTSFTVDTAYWSMMDEYGYDVEDPVTGEVTYKEMTAAQYIAEYNADLAAGRTPKYPRLSFNVSYGDVRDTDHVTSDHFITVVYTALHDIVAPVEGSPDIAFGFDMTSGGRLTHAASDSAHLMTLLYQTGDATAAISADMDVFHVIAELDVTLAANQTISYHYDAEADPQYYLDVDDIALTFVKPIFESGETNPYLADGGEIRYEFYTYDADSGEYVLITDGEDQPALPSLPSLTDYYVKAVLPATTHFEGAESEIVPIAVAPIYVDLPHLRLYDDGAHAETPAVMSEPALTLETSVTYGTIMALKERVNDEDVLFELPEELSVSYRKFVGETGSIIDYDPLTATLPSVGTYVITITTADTDYVAFYQEGSQTLRFTITITVTITKAELTLSARVYGETEKHITYGDAAPASSDLTYVAEGVFETGEARTALLDSLNVLVSSAAPYAQFSHVGTYLYTASTEVVPENYTVAYGPSAKLIVDAKALTVVVDYDGGVATLSCEGVVNGDQVTVSYRRVGDDEDLPSNVYTVGAADYAICADDGVITIKATPNPEATDYTFGSVELKKVFKVSFAKGAGFEDATDMPSAQYIFDGCAASMPNETPLYYRYAFSYWMLNDQPYAFDTTSVTEDVILTAVWEKMIYAYRFRALYEGADYASEKYYHLRWDADQEKFVMADASETALFEKNTAIPVKAQIKGFFLQSWIKVIPLGNDEYEYTEVALFDVQTSTDVNEGAYYIAVMMLNVGKGDVNGDGEVSALDVLAMKRYLVSTTYHMIETVEDAWDAVTAVDPEGGYFYMPMWDVNDDQSPDARDIVTIREALVTGYGYAVMKDVTADGVYRPGAQVVKEDGANYQGHVYIANDIEELDELLAAGRKVALGGDIESEAPIEVAYEGDLSLDLGGKTLSAESLSVTVTGKMVIRNGKLDVDALALVAPGGITLTGVKNGEGQSVTAEANATQFNWGE